MPAGDLQQLEKFFSNQHFCGGLIPPDREFSELAVPAPIPRPEEHEIVKKESIEALENVTEFIDGLHHGWSSRISVRLLEKIVTTAAADAKPSLPDCPSSRFFRCVVRCTIVPHTLSNFTTATTGMTGSHPKEKIKLPMQPPAGKLSMAMFTHSEDGSSGRQTSPDMEPGRGIRETRYILSFEAKNLVLEVAVTWVPVDQQPTAPPDHQSVTSSDKKCPCWICEWIERSRELDDPSLEQKIESGLGKEKLGVKIEPGLGRGQSAADVKPSFGKGQLEAKVEPGLGKGSPA